MQHLVLKALLQKKKLSVNALKAKLIRIKLLTQYDGLC